MVKRNPKRFEEQRNSVPFSLHIPAANRFVAELWPTQDRFIGGCRPEAGYWLAWGKCDSRKRQHDRAEKAMIVYPSGPRDSLRCLAPTSLSS
jgi:hypothetical protein